MRARLWHDDHVLDLGYLRNPPMICAWRVVQAQADVVTIAWRHNDASDIRFTAPVQGDVTVQTETFRSA